jgi:hypothetical protein
LRSFRKRILRDFNPNKVVVLPDLQTLGEMVPRRTKLHRRYMTAIFADYLLLAVALESRGLEKATRRSYSLAFVRAKMKIRLEYLSLEHQENY